MMKGTKFSKINNSDDERRRISLLKRVDDIEDDVVLDFHDIDLGSMSRDDASSSNAIVPDDIEQNITLSTLKDHPGQVYLQSSRDKIKGALWICIFCVLPLLIVVIVLATLLAEGDSDSSSEPSTYSWKPFEATSSSMSGAVATDNADCSNIGLSILAKGGNAIEAAIAATFCLGVISPASSGIGGGCFMLIHNATSGDNEFIDSREVAPNKATSDMYVKYPLNAQDGSLAPAVLAEVKGLELAYQRHGSGNVTWSELVLPAAILAKSWTISPQLHFYMNKEAAKLLSGDFPLLSSLYLKNNGKLKDIGDEIAQPKLVNTLAMIAEQGSSYLYSTMAEVLSQELLDAGGIMTTQDITSYSPVIHPAIQANIAGYTFISVGGSSSGGLVVIGLLKFMASIPQPLISLGNDYYHWLVEGMKHVFAMRSSLGDPDYVNTTGVMQALLSDEYMSALQSLSGASNPLHALGMQQYGGKYNLQYASQVDHGTSHLSVIDQHGNAISMTSTVNTYFGSKFVSASTGLLWNNQMDDFSIPNASNYFGIAPSPFNFPEPSKKPLSSMSPCMLLDSQGRVRLIGGASGGPKIITATAQMLLNRIWFGMDLLSAVRRPRIHSQLLPDKVSVEQQHLVSGQLIAASDEVYELLKVRGHHNVTWIDDSFGVSQFISIEYSGEDKVYVQAVSDPRKDGRPAILD